MISPFQIPPHPLAQAAAQEVIERVHAYMQAHPESELHRQGKMFGVLIYNDGMSRLRLNDAATQPNDVSYLAAFSAMLDGSYYHEGFVPPVYEMSAPPVGLSKTESQRLQRLLFTHYRFVNGQGETKNLLEIFMNEKPIVPADEWFNRSSGQRHFSSPYHSLPPSGAGECCAPKLLQYALTHGLQPFALAEFWVGAPSRTEIRQEGCFYPPCSGKCVPILRHMLRGIDVEQTPQIQQAEALCRQIETVYEDEYLLVVNKPSGLLSVPGKTDEISAESYFRLQNSNLGFLKAVHRLDQDTSGLLVLAKTPDVYKQLQAYFQRRDILKRYEAVVKPNDTMSRAKALNEPLALNDGVISLPLLPNPLDRPRQMVEREHGKPAITRYQVRERREDGSVLVDFYPQTGRTHQLRVHAAHPDGLNAPIVGDRLYNGERSEVKGERLLLHAAEIRFVHPVTQEEMHFCIPSHF